MAFAQDRPGSYLTAARELTPRIAAAADDINRERELPDELFAELADKGFFRLFVPRSLGGGEIDYLEHLSIVQTFAEVDGSTAWCINQNNVFATVSAKMPEPLAREIWECPAGGGGKRSPDKRLCRSGQWGIPPHGSVEF